LLLLHLIICKSCGKKFTALKKKRKYCSQSCSSKHKDTGIRILKICEQCGKEYFAYHKYFDRFCSKRCYSKNFYPIWAHAKWINRLLNRIKTRSKKLNLEPSDLTEDYLKSIVTTHCPILGIEIHKFSPGVNGPQSNSISLDRVNNSRGYIKGNVCFISQKANSLKRDATLEELEKIVNYMKTYQCVA